MHRRRVLTILAAGIPLSAGCNTLTGGNDGGGGNETTQSTPSSDGGETSPTSAATTTLTDAGTTVAATARMTATQAPTATSTPLPTATPTLTAGPGTVTGPMDLDLSTRETYTNNTYSYAIEYPAAWSVDDGDPTYVSFASPSAPGRLLVLTRSGVPPSATLEQAATQFQRGYLQSGSGSTETLNQEQVTLPNGNSGVLFDFRLSTGSVSVRQNAVVTLANDTLYAATVVVPEAVYTSTVGQQMDEILLSLTISTGTATDSEQLDLSPLVSYTNTMYGYRIDRPANWTVNDSSPQVVEIANPDRDVIRISVFEGQYASVTLEEVVDIALTNRRSRTSVEVLNRQEITLRSGHPAIVLDTTYDLPTDVYGSLRSYLLLAKQDDTVYQVEFVADATDWTSTVEREGRRIVESFTLSDGTVALDRALAFVHGRYQPTIG